MDNLFSTRPSAHYVNLKFFRTISLITAVAVTALSLNTICSNPAYANTNSAATSAINSLKTQHHYKPGEYGKSTYSCISKGQDWLAYKPASTNCKAECWAFATGVSKKLFGNIATPSGIATKTGYKATNIGNYSTVASRTWPSYNNMVDDFKKASPGDWLQFCGGSAYGSAQHSAIIESVDKNGATIYQHTDSLHVTSTYHNWNYLYYTYCCLNKKNKSGVAGYSIYHANNYNSKFPVGPVEPKVTSIGNGTYLIRSAMDKGFSLDVEGQSKSQANVYMWACHNKPSQQWKFTKMSDGTYVITNINSGLALDVAGALKTDGTNVQQYPVINNDNAQRWYVCDGGNGLYYLKCKCSGKYLDVKSSGRANGTNVHQWGYNNGTPNQKFYLVPYGEIGTITTKIADGYYVIRASANNAYALDCQGNKTSNNTNIQLYSSYQGPAQVFYFKKQDGYYTISPISKLSMKMDMSGWGFSNGDNVQLFESNSSKAQHFYIRDCGKGLYAIQNIGNGLFVDISGGVLNNETNIQGWVGGNTPNQKFELVPWSTSILDMSRTTISGVKTSYDSSNVKPEPKVTWKASDRKSLRVPVSGNASGNYCNARIGNLRANHTYEVTIGSASHLAGNAPYAQLRAVSSNGLDDATRATIKWSSSSQTVTIKPNKNSNLYIYPGIADSTSGNAAIFQNVTVREVLIKNTDYQVSYAPGSVKVIGMSPYTGTKVLNYTVTKKTVSEKTKKYSFIDVNASTPHADDIQWLADNQISTGWQNPNGTKSFRPYDNIARADMAAFLFRTAQKWGKVNGNWLPNARQKQAFSDVDSSTPHAREIWWLASTGISTGWKEANGKSTFRPLSTVKRQDMAAFLFRLAGLAQKGGASAKWTARESSKNKFRDVSPNVSDNHHREIWWLAEKGISTGWDVGNGKSEFRGMADVARCDMAAFLCRMNRL